MHLKHILTTSLLVLSGTVPATAEADPNPNIANLGLRNAPMNNDYTPQSSASSGAPSSSSGYGYESQTPSSMSPTSSPTPTPYSSSPSTLQSSMRSSSAFGQSSTPASSGYYPSSSSPASSSGSGNLLGGILGDKSLQLRAEPTPQYEEVGPGYMQPAYQPAARPT